MRFGSLVLAMAFISTSLQAEEAYPPTPVGAVELKTLPPARIIVTESGESYFSQNNRLFGRLFRYIDANSIPMTTPVEARIEPGSMIFHLDSKSARRDDLQETEVVKIQDYPERLVAAIGIRGSYSAENYNRNLEKLRIWIAEQPQLQLAGEPYAVYWNGPFVPGPFKRSEVHYPVRRVEPIAGD
jgi:effector-binding domain-containing protein